MFLELDHETLMELVSIEGEGGRGGGGGPQEWMKEVTRKEQWSFRLKGKRREDPEKPATEKRE